MRYPLLSSSFSLGGLTLANRTVMSPMSSGLGNMDGSVSEAQIAFYRARAEGGVGLVIVEFTGVNRRLGLAEANQLSLDSRDNLDGQRRLVAAIRQAGSKAALQLHAPGRHCDRSTVNGLPAGPSDEFSKRDGTTRTARALTTDEIEELIDCFGRSAELAIEAGYEAIEIHGAHGYLPMAFLSPLANRRDDRWGGDFDRRLAFSEAVIRRVKTALGPQRPLLYRLSSCEHLPGGLTIEDMEKIAPRLVAAGVDCLDVSTGTLAGSLDLTIDPMSMPEGWRFADSRRIREATGVPVIGIGPVRWPATAEEALARKDADLICLGRPLLADAAWPAKAISGHTADIRPCTNCNWCFSRVLEHLPIGCAEAPATGNELDPLPEFSARGERVVVVGGGPGGMAAALALDARGFETHLFEARDRLGGGLIASAAPPLKEKLFWYRDYLTKRIEGSGVTQHLNQTGDLAAIDLLNPVLTVIATGAQSLQNAIQGAAEGAVIGAYALLMGDARIDLCYGETVAVYGGGETGCETAEYLAGQGFHVKLITRSPARDLARSAEIMYRKHLLRRLTQNRNIDVIDTTSVLSFTASILELQRADGTISRLGARRLVMAQGRAAGHPLAQTLAGAGYTVKIIGDAERVGRIGDAVHAADRAVRSVLKDLQETSLSSDRRADRTCP